MYNTNIIKIEMSNDENKSYHSAASYALIMREVEYIAKYGLTNLCKLKYN
jgi:hypothetical protein